MPATVALPPVIQRDTADNSAVDALLPELKGLLSIDFDQHDARLKTCLASAFQFVEKHTGVLLKPAAVSLVYPELYDYEDLPGPVTGSIATSTYANGALTVTGLTGAFPRLSGNYPAGVKLSYTAGYEVDKLPDDLKEGVLALAANRFDNGERNWAKIVAGSRRGSWAS